MPACTGSPSASTRSRRPLPAPHARDELARGALPASTRRAAGFGGLKLDTVVMRGINDDEIARPARVRRGVGAEVRFIEYMDVGGATRWRPEARRVAARDAGALAERYGPLAPLVEDSAAPAERFRLPDGTRLRRSSLDDRAVLPRCDRAGSPPTACGCRACMRRAASTCAVRCRAGASADDLAGLIAGRGQRRRPRRRSPPGEADRRVLIARRHAADQPHLEMHTRGG